MWCGHWHPFAEKLGRIVEGALLWAALKLRKSAGSFCEHMVANKCLQL